MNSFIPIKPKESYRYLIKLRIVVFLTIVGFFFAGDDALAQDLEPRAYSNAPVGINSILTGYGYMSGGVLPDPSVPIEDADVKIHSTLIAYVRTFGIMGNSAKVAFMAPYAWADGSGKLAGESKQRDVAGFADPRIRLTVNLYGSPSLSLKDFKDYQQDTIVGLGFLVTAPGGQYDSDKLLNIGTNRWSFKPEIGVSQALGQWVLEMAAAVSFYADNDDFLGGKNREQDPVYSVQGHVIYRFQNHIWGALDATYYTGGRTEVDGVRKDDLQDNWRFGATLSVPVNRNNSINLYGSTGVSVRSGSDFDAIGIAWLHRWGGGL